MKTLLDAQPERFERRLRLVPISTPFLTRILHGGYPQDVRDIVTDLPEDAHVVHVQADLTRDCVVAIVRSAAFEPVDEGHVIPEWNPHYTVVERVG